MAEPIGIPEEFIFWLTSNYTPEQVRSWGQEVLSAGGELWKNNDVFLYWQQYKSPEAKQQQLTDNLGQQVGEDALWEYLQDYQKESGVSDFELEDLFFQYQEQANYNKENYLALIGMPEDVKADLESYTSVNDLNDRLSRLNLDPQTASYVYEAIRPDMTDTERRNLGVNLRAARVREQEAQQEGADERSKYQQALAPALSKIANSKFTTPEDLTNLRENVDNPAVVNNILDILDYRERKAELTQKIEGEREGQHAEALLRGSQQGIRFDQPQAEKFERPPIPGVTSLLESEYKKSNLGEGTKLSEFLASELVKTTEATRGERQAWWERMNPEPEEPGRVKTYRDEQSRIMAERDRWSQIAQTAPTSTVAGGTYYGEGGLAAIAQNAYETSVRNLSKMEPEDYAEEEEPKKRIALEEDPLVAALRGVRQSYRSKYFRQPGTGIVNRLSPSVKY